MAEFNPDTPNIEARNYLNLSQGTGTDRSFETLFKGIGEGISGLVKTGDNYLQNKIQVDARDAAERVNQELNLDVSTVPQEITQTQGDLTRLATAQSQGKITPEYYYARLASTMRGLRSRYPGYEKEVDQAMQAATGINPANAFRNALLENIQKVQTAQSAAADKVQNRFMNNAQWSTADEINDYNTTGGKKYGGVEGLVRNQMLRESADKQRTIAADTAKNNAWDAKNIFSGQIAQMGSDTMGDMMKESGLGGQGILKKIQDAQAAGGAGIPDDQIATMVAYVGQQRQLLQAKLNQYGASFPNVTAADKKTEIDGVLKQYDDLMQLIQQKQFSEAANLVLRNQATVDRSTSDLYKIPGMSGAAALSKIAPDTANTAAKDILQAQPGGITNALQNMGVSDGVRSVINGSARSNDVVGGIVNSNNDPKVKQAMLAQYIDKLTGVAGSVKTSPEEMRTFVQNTYGVNTDGDKLWQTVLPEDRLLLFSKMFAPSVTQAVANTKDPAALQTYMAAAAERFTAIPSFQEAAKTLASDLSQSKFMRARLNPQTNQIEIQYDQAAAQASGKVVQMSQMLTTSELRNFTQQFNTGLKTLLPIIQAAGGDPNKEIPAILANMGARLEGGKQNGFFNTLAAYIDAALGTQPEDKLGPDGKLAPQPSGDWQTLQGTEGSNPPGQLDFNVPGPTRQQSQNTRTGLAPVQLASFDPNEPTGDRQGGSRSWRNNNPGNIEFGNFARNSGATGTDGRFAIFPDYATGRAAQEKLLFDSPGYRNLTLAQAIAKWAPSSENNVPAYVRAMGADPGTKMSEFSPEQRTALLDAMQQHEGWRPGRMAEGSGVAKFADLPMSEDEVRGGGMAAATPKMLALRDSSNIEDRRNEFSADQVAEAHKVADAEVQKNPNDAKIKIEDAADYMQGDTGSIATVGSHVFYIPAQADLTSSKDWKYLGTKEQWQEQSIEYWKGEARKKKNPAPKSDQEVGQRLRDQLK